MHHPAILAALAAERRTERLRAAEQRRLARLARGGSQRRRRRWKAWRLPMLKADRGAGTDSRSGDATAIPLGRAAGASLLEGDHTSPRI